MNKSFIIGIAGGSASGKTTFCKALVKSLSEHNVKVFYMDDYIWPTKEQMPQSKSPITGKTYTDQADFNHPDAIDWPRLKEDLSVAKEEFIIVEGLFALANDDIYHLLDLKLFIDCKADERIVRKLKRYREADEIGHVRDVEEIFGWLSDYNLDVARYRHDEYIEPTKWRADMILNGSIPSDKTLDMVKGYILNMTQK
jgi:uridine kinase